MEFGSSSMVCNDSEKGVVDFQRDAVIWTSIGATI